ncbi:MAG: hypothetical protein KF789_13905 [Bdellovibrionaceae bacterium]|nr:hypothetical protein [Pseudobdellovibrionaceae bacterium]
MRSKTIRTITMTAVSLILLVSFQNCGKAGFDGASEGALDFSSFSKTDADPFAFNAAFDQISYNSCFGPSSMGKPGFYSIKAGAYSSAGVSMSQAFKDHVYNGETLRPIYPEDTVTPEQVKNYLAKSGANTMAVPQLSLRTRSNVQQIRSPGGSVTEYVDFVPMLSDLTDDRWMHPIVTGGTSISNLFFNFAPEGARRLEATLSYNQSEATAENLRNDQASAGMLALTYRPRPDIAEPYAARAPAGAAYGVAYGRGYNLTFDRAQTVFTACAQSPSNCTATNLPIYNLAPTNILTAITEIDLEKPTQAVSQWNCSQKRRYTVVRYADAAALCPPDLGDYLDYPELRKEYEIVRRHLNPQEWDVNLALRCVVPKKGGCYDSQYSNLNIAYNQQEACFQNLETYRAMYGTSVPAKLCAQFISICVK